eukprot:501204_1
MADLQQFLDQYKLSTYAEALTEYGAENIDDLLDLDDDELAEAADECSMKKLHKKKFIKGINQLKSGGGTTEPQQQQQYVAPTQPHKKTEKKQEEPNDTDNEIDDGYENVKKHELLASIDKRSQQD